LSKAEINTRLFLETPRENQIYMENIIKMYLQEVSNKNVKFMYPFSTTVYFSLQTHIIRHARP